jgi:hypothetical protein
MLQSASVAARLTSVCSENCKEKKDSIPPLSAIESMHSFPYDARFVRASDDSNCCRAVALTLRHSDTSACIGAVRW